ncbi:MAG: hypothetical protein WCF16_04870, partial [Alphaproteobacteria bacterium]
MPRITTFDGPSGPPGEELHLHADAAAIAAPFAALERAGGALTALGAEFLRRQQEALRAQRLSEATLGAVRDLDTLQGNLANDTDPATLPDRYRAEAQSIADR